MTRKQNRQQIRDAKQFLKKENTKAPIELTKVPKELWPTIPKHHTKPEKVFYSKTFMVQEYKEGYSTRLSICRTSIDENGAWKADIQWEELQEIKRQVGYGDRLAVEIFPTDKNIVNVANMRHLWIIDNLDIGWEK